MMDLWEVPGMVAKDHSLHHGVDSSKQHQQCVQPSELGL